MAESKAVWHTLTSEEVERELQTDLQKGLGKEEAAQRLQERGPNALTQSRGPSKILLFLQQFHQPLVYILLAATLVTLLLKEYVDASVIFAVLLINAIIGYLQELKAIEAIEALAKMGHENATVLREGEQLVVDAKELVPGDLVVVYSGDKVPADLRLIKAKELFVDESALTGESVSVAKTTRPLEQNTPLAERTNMAYSSSLITAGSAYGVVAETGDHTQIGKINAMIKEADILETPLTIKITAFSKYLLYVILIMAALTFAVGTLRGEDATEMFMAAVALAVGAIPEGLPAAMTIILAIGVAKMAKQNAIIRKLPAVETLGSTTVICSDKTGTLTQNAMTVKRIYAGGESFDVAGVGYLPEGEITPASKEAELESDALYKTLSAGLMCNTSKVYKEQEHYRVQGDPTEGALIVSAQKAGLQKSVLESELLHIDTLDFDSQNQYMATYYGAKDKTNSFIYLKGSLEKILERCDTMVDAAGEVVAIDRDKIVKEAEDMAKEGMRVLAFAYLKMSAWVESLQHSHVSEGLTFLGLQAMIDPPRQEVKDSIASCYKAGIDVKMITGDHKITALAIAKQIGLRVDSDDAALSGVELEECDDEKLHEVIKRVNVFARVAPKQKLRLVKALQEHDDVVAMTGDGVNDAPALRQANIGTAMGITGTEVAKEAADMILTDDNFATIKNAVHEGRGVFDNIIKFITWTLPTNIGEGLVIMSAVFFGLALPILPVQILWINMSTAVLLGLMLAFEPKEKGLMLKKPRAPGTAILTRELMIRVLYVGLLLLVLAFGAFWYLTQQGTPMEQARSVAVNIFVFGEMFYLFTCRSMTRSMFALGVFSNGWLIFGVSVMTLLQLLFTYAPFMNTIFESAPLGVAHWVMILAASTVIYTAVELEKYIKRKGA